MRWLVPYCSNRPIWVLCNKGDVFANVVIDLGQSVLNRFAQVIDIKKTFSDSLYLGRKDAKEVHCTWKLQ